MQLAALCYAIIIYELFGFALVKYLFISTSSGFVTYLLRVILLVMTLLCKSCLLTFQLLILRFFIF